MCNKQTKNVHHIFSVLLHYLVKCKRSKMTQIGQKLQQNLNTLKYHTSRNVVGPISYQCYYSNCSKFSPSGRKQASATR